MILSSHKLVVLWSFLFILLLSGIQSLVEDCSTHIALERNLNYTGQQIHEILVIGAKVHHGFSSLPFTSEEKKNFELKVKQEGEENLRKFLTCLGTYLEIMFEKIPLLQLPQMLTSTAKDPENQTFLKLMSELLQKYYNNFKSEIKNIQNDVTLQKRFGLSGGEEIPLNIDTIGPGQGYPRYTWIPYTSFQCEYMNYVPGFYADVETDCQVFHVCWQNRRESFLCPIGTIFNQQTLTCDLWYRSRCQLAPSYYSINEELRDVADYEFMEIDDPAYARLLDPYYDSKRYSHTLLLANGEIRYVPIAYRTIFYPEGLLFPNRLKFQNFDATFPEHFNNAYISPEQLNNLAMKIYNEMEKTEINGPFNENYKSYRNFPDFEHFPENEQLHSDVLYDRVGPKLVRLGRRERAKSLKMPSTNKSTEFSTFKESSSEQTATKQGFFFTASESPENKPIINIRIEPKTKEVLASSYSKLFKVDL